MSASIKREFQNKKVLPSMDKVFLGRIDEFQIGEKVNIFEGCLLQTDVSPDLTKLVQVLQILVQVACKKRSR